MNVFIPLLIKILIATIPLGTICLTSDFAMSTHCSEKRRTLCYEQSSNFQISTHVDINFDKHWHKLVRYFFELEWQTYDVLKKKNTIMIKKVFYILATDFIIILRCSCSFLSRSIPIVLFGDKTQGVMGVRAYVLEAAVT